MKPNLSATVLSLKPIYINRQAAIKFLGVKPGYFDKNFKPYVREIKAGTQRLYLPQELEARANNHFGGGVESSIKHGQDASSQSTQKGSKPWEKNQAASSKDSTADGSSTNSSKASGFTKALSHLKTQKRGSPGSLKD